MNAVISPNNRSNFNMTSKVRDLPVELSLLPYEASITFDEEMFAAAVPFTCT